jgi:hypothetical protein
MTKNTKTVVLAGIAAGVLIVLVIVARDWLLTSKTIRCSDGLRRTIDTRDFNTKYWAYSVEFEAIVADKAKFSGKLDPVQLQQLSEAMQSANEFRKYVVHGYNACAIGGTRYDQYGARFQTLDSLSREMDTMAKRTTLSGEERLQLADLTKQYLEVVRKLGE